VCSTVTYSSVHSCDLNGRFISIVLESTVEQPFCLTEIGAYSTVNLAPYAEVSFSGDSDYSPQIIVDGPTLSTCSDQENCPCFEAQTAGSVLIDFTETFLSDVFRIFGNGEDDLDVTFDSFPVQTIQSSWGNEWAINSQISSF
jgi:hypothetical protein